ncbi:MAG: hypothetical protein GWP91_17890 [Rhodobacterales bacterium]|nr:hypothetical protein [Rhodobacterales bacterium]
MRHWNRRDFIVATACAGMVGCPKGRSSQVLLQYPVTLGWRWVPGARWTWRTQIKRSGNSLLDERAETWRYTVLSFDEFDVATLEARLIELGLEAEGRESEWRRERNRLNQTVTLRLGMDGQLLWCSEPDLMRSMPHRMLAMRLPLGAIAEHDEWPDADLTRPWARLLPAALDLDIQAHTRLVELFQDEIGACAALASEGRIRMGHGGPTLNIIGEARFSTVMGVLLHRHLQARISPADGLTGALDLTLTRIG